MMTIADKIRKYCSYQERCCQEVRVKLSSFHLPKQETEALIQQMLNENFVNEERYVECFIRGKINVKKWGKVKIKCELLQKQIASSLIEEKLNEIDNDLYINNLILLIDKWKSLNEGEDKMKLYRFLLSKGYESNIINTYINK